jgi:hypothetical protein
MVSLFYTTIFYSLVAVIAIAVVGTLMYDELSGMFYSVLDFLTGTGKWHR